MPRFVVLEHDHPVLHWDFMLEHEGRLRTWRLRREPGDDLVPAEPLPEHRIEYLDYEGPVSGDRGFVTRWDAGTYEVGETADGESALLLAGQRLVGRAEFVTVDGDLYLRVGAEPSA